jgi:hypothetical protein
MGSFPFDARRRWVSISVPTMSGNTSQIVLPTIDGAGW